MQSALSQIVPVVYFQFQKLRIFCNCSITAELRSNISMPITKEEIRFSNFNKIIDVLDLNFKVKLSEFYSFASVSK